MNTLQDATRQEITAHYELMPAFSKKANIKSLLGEALRRYCLHHAGESLSTAWVGLGTEAQYRPAVDAGLMTWHDGKLPPKRCMGWLVLTKKGEQEILRMMAEVVRGIA